MRGRGFPRQSRQGSCGGPPADHVGRRRGRPTMQALRAVAFPAGFVGEAIRSRHRRRSSTPRGTSSSAPPNLDTVSPGDTRSAAVGSSLYTPPRRAAPTHPDRRRHRPEGCKSASTDCTGPVTCRFRCTGRRPDLGVVFAVVLTSVIARDASPRPRRGSAGPDAHRGTRAAVTGHAVPGRTPRGPPRLCIVGCADV